MRILATSAMVAVAALGLGAPSAGAMTPAQKMSLTRTNRDCGGTIIGAEFPQPFGFAVVTSPASGKLVAAVALKGAVPNTTYNIRVIQILPDNSDCGSYISGPFDGTLTTDDLGSGNANIHEAVLPDASMVFVDLNSQVNPGGDFYDTQPVSF
jgi:hypothetical protein